MAAQTEFTVKIASLYFHACLDFAEQFMFPESKNAAGRVLLVTTRSSDAVHYD